jgi:hypothetical protein
MAVLKRHIELFREVFAVRGLLAAPVLTLGFQDILGDELPPDFDHPDLGALLRARGVAEVTTLDHFDPRADLRHDMNLPLPAEMHERYATVIDIGTIEHVFDTRQCIESSLRAVKTGGHYFVHTPVKGYFQHGFHTFDPRALIQALGLNGFEIVHRRFSSQRGEPLEHSWDADDVLIWLVGRKTAPLEKFEIPQQRRWREAYEPGDSAARA